MRNGSLGIRRFDGDTSSTFWGTAIFNWETSIRDFGPPVDAGVSLPKHSNSKMEDLAHIYLTYQDPCLGGQTDPFTMFDLNKFRTYKATFQMCLKTLFTKFNVSTSTRVVTNHTDLPWKYYEPNWTVRLDGNLNEYRIGSYSLDSIALQLASSFNLSSSFRTGGDNYIDGTAFGLSLMTDVMGFNPLECPNDIGYGFEGFTRRVEYIAAGVTDA